MIAGSPRVVASGDTNTGRVREHNEDAIFVDKGLALFVVADGMGGMAAGEIASSIVVEMLRRELSRGTLSSSPSAFLREAIKKANYRVFYHSMDHPEKRGMGSTVVALALSGKRFYHAHAGDSRLYRLRQGQLAQLTEDHSLVYALYREGKISKTELMSDRRANQISRAVGIIEDLELDLAEGDLESGDLFLLCSDGLHGLVEDVKIAELLKTQETPAVVVQKLIELANERGGKDNISAVIARVDDVPDGSDPAVDPMTQQTQPLESALAGRQPTIRTFCMASAVAGFLLGALVSRCFPTERTRATQGLVGPVAVLATPTSSSPGTPIRMSPPQAAQSLGAVPLTGSVPEALRLPASSQPTAGAVPANHGLAATRPKAPLLPAPEPKAVVSPESVSGFTRKAIMGPGSDRREAWFAFNVADPGDLTATLQCETDIPIFLSLFGPQSSSGLGPSLSTIDCAGQKTTVLIRGFSLSSAGVYHLWLYLPVSRQPTELDLSTAFVPRRSTVSLSLFPPDLSLEIDGHAATAASLASGKLDLPFGRHRWRAGRDGYLTTAGVLELANDATLQVRLQADADASPSAPRVARVGVAIQDALGEPEGNVRDHWSLKTSGLGTLTVKRTQGQIRWRLSDGTVVVNPAAGVDSATVACGPDSQCVVAVDLPQAALPGTRYPYSFESTFKPWPRVVLKLRSQPAGAAVTVKGLSAKGARVTPCELESEPLGAAASADLVLKLDGYESKRVRVDLNPEIPQIERTVTLTAVARPVAPAPVVERSPSVVPAPVLQPSPVGSPPETVPVRPAAEPVPHVWAVEKVFKEGAGEGVGVRAASITIPSDLPPGARVTLTPRFSQWPVSVYLAPRASVVAITGRDLTVQAALDALSSSIGGSFERPSSASYVMPRPSLPADSSVVVASEIRQPGVVEIRIEWP